MFQFCIIFDLSSQPALKFEKIIYKCITAANVFARQVGIQCERLDSSAAMDSTLAGEGLLLAGGRGVETGGRDDVDLLAGPTVRHCDDSAEVPVRPRL